MLFEYHDRDGNNELGAECFIYPSKETLTVNVGVLSGDSDGDSYRIYVPNHKDKIRLLIQELQEVLDASQDVPEGYDGFSFNYAAAQGTNDELYDEDEIGIVEWY